MIAELAELAVLAVLADSFCGQCLPAQVVFHFLRRWLHVQVIRIVPPNTTVDDDSDDNQVEPVSHEQLLEELRQQAVKPAPSVGKPSVLP